MRRFSNQSLCSEFLANKGPRLNKGSTEVSASCGLTVHKRIWAYLSLSDTYNSVITAFPSICFEVCCNCVQKLNFPCHGGHLSEKDHPFCGAIACGW